MTAPVQLTESWQVLEADLAEPKTFVVEGGSAKFTTRDVPVANSGTTRTQGQGIRVGVGKTVRAKRANAVIPTSVSIEAFG